MIRLFVLVEGQTEEAFVKRVMYEHLLAHEVDARPIIVTTRRDRATGRKLGRGGGTWAKWLKDLRRLTSEHPKNDDRFTSLFDLYGLPDDFPGLQQHAKVHDTLQRATLLEQEMANVVGDWRFVPYLQRHEFEALVFAGLDRLGDLLDSPEQREGLDRLRQAVLGVSPEDVNDGKETAPSRRLIAHVPGYQKILHGPLVVEGLGLGAIRKTCSRFGEWLTRLETLPALPQPV